MISMFRYLASTNQNANLYVIATRRFDKTTFSQEILVWKDFNIEDEAGMAQKKLVKRVPNVNVTSNVLEIRFYWAGKGTTRTPERGDYGPLISAISVVSGESVLSTFLHFHFSTIILD